MRITGHLGSTTAIALLMAAATAPGATAAIISSNADTYVKSGSNATTNYGSEEDLELRSSDTSSGDNRRKIYLQFDLSAYTDITAASLTLTLDVALGGSRSFVLYGLNTDTSWAEGTINWNNAPANDTTSGTAFTAGATQLATLSASSGATGQLTFTFDTDAVTFLNNDTDGVITLMLTKLSNGGLDYFQSKETPDGTAPFLTITAAPEPGSLVLIGLGALAMARRRR